MSTSFPILNLPPVSLKVQRAKSGRLTVFDPLRKKYVTLTAEEWVRQHFCHYLIEQRGVPPTLIGNEISLNLCGVTRRCDTVVYRSGSTQPLMIIEYKAPQVRITESVFTQIQSYNSIFRAEYLVVSNGMQHFCCHMDYEKQEVCYLQEIPLFTSL